MSKPDAAIQNLNVAETVTIVLDLWREVLRLPTLTIHDKFNQLGKSSIDAMRLMARMERAGFSVSLRDIMHHETVAMIVDEVLTPRFTPLITDTTELLDLLQDETGSVFTYVRVAVHRDEGVREQTILFGNSCLDHAKNWLRASRIQLDPRMLPDYFFNGPLWPELKNNDVLTGAQFDRYLNLLPLERETVLALRGQLDQVLLHNHNLIKQSGIPHQYPLCGMQQLQIGFKTPASLDFLMITDDVDLDLLQKAYGLLISKQGLLRSLAIKKNDQYYWQEYRYHKNSDPLIPLVDFSAFTGDEATFREVLTDLVLRVYEPEHILHQLVLVRKTHKIHYLVMVFSHVIFDRVSGETVKSQLMELYEDLLYHRPVKQEQLNSFSAYSSHVRRGPQRIDESALIRRFELEAFYSSKQALRKKLKGLESDVSYSFNVIVPLPGADDHEYALQKAVAVYAKAVQHYFELEMVPLLLVSEGRQYENRRYYNTIGEFNDMIPMVVDPGQSAAAIIDSVTRRLEQAKQDNVNFLNLLLNPACSSSWEETIRLMDAGVNFGNFDLLMFNFLGNKPEEEVYDQEEFIQTGPNPLPVYSLLNCICTTVKEQLVFMIRCSYRIDIDQLRKLFSAAAVEI